MTQDIFALFLTLLHIDNPYFEQTVSQIHAFPTGLQLTITQSSDTAALFLNLDLSITDGIASSKFYDTWDDFNF